MKKFLISSLLAAGFFNIADASSDKNIEIEKTENVDLINNSKGLKSIAERNVPLYTNGSLFSWIAWIARIT